MRPVQRIAPEKRLVWDPVRREMVPAGSIVKGPAGRFIKGPLPLTWMQEAARLPGKTLQVALTLWYLAGLQKTSTVRLASRPLDLMGVSRDAKYEALARLANAGLVTVEQKVGQAPMVTLHPQKGASDPTG